MAAGSGSGGFAQLRAEMVEEQLTARGIANPRVLRTMRTLPREAFVDDEMADVAYCDEPLPIGFGQTISQPYIVALMAELAELSPGDRVLEIGTGCGYAAAVYAGLAGEVFTVERHPALAEQARLALRRIGADNVTVCCGDGSIGLGERAPFDAILVAAGAPRVPDCLKRQLAVGGRLIIPVAVSGCQHLVRVRREAGGSFTEESIGAVAFVPLVGEEGWLEPAAAGRAVESTRKLRPAEPV